MFHAVPFVLWLVVVVVVAFIVSNWKVIYCATGPFHKPTCVGLWNGLGYGLDWGRQVSLPQ